MIWILTISLESNVVLSIFFALWCGVAIDLPQVIAEEALVVVMVATAT